MSEFQRYTAYLYLYEASRPVRSIGYLKRSKRQDSDRLIVNVGGYYTEGAVTGTIFAVFEYGDHYRTQELGQITIENSHGEVRLDLPEEVESHVGIAILIQNQQCIGWYDGSTIIPNIEYPFQSENDVQEQEVINEITEEQSTEEQGTEEQSTEEQSTEEQSTEEQNTKEQDTQRQDTKEPDFWSQLTGVFPMVYPFEYPVDAEYLSVTPNELLKLPKSEHVLIQNSFLQHAYYNYKYIILGKKDEDFYVGVPGIYHEREIMMANMFGFEEFLCAKKEQPVQGCFGYYMKRVSINTTE